MIDIGALGRRLVGVQLVLLATEVCLLALARLVDGMQRRLGLVEAASIERRCPRGFRLGLLGNGLGGGALRRAGTVGRLVGSNLNASLYPTARRSGTSG
jgi:hypothetical protein